MTLPWWDPIPWSSTDPPNHVPARERDPELEQLMKDLAARVSDHDGVAVSECHLATETKGMMGRDEQSGTRDATLDHFYVQDGLKPKVELALLLSLTVSKGVSGT